MGRAFCILTIFCVFSTSAAFAVEKWIYASRNLQVDASVAELEAIMKRGKAVGYTHLLLSDSKFSRLDTLGDRYFKNANRIKSASNRIGIEIIPSVFAVGYSNGLLFHDPNLIEALPVRGLPLVVRNGAAVVDDPDAPTLPGGTMENLKQWSWRDDCIVLDDGAAKIVPDGRNARMAQRIKVKPWRQYHVSVRVKTDHFKGTPEIKALAGDQSLCFTHLGVQPTQEWTDHHTVFNSQNATDVTVIFGVWGAQSGALWWDDARIEPVAFLNLARRGGCPLRLRTEAGKLLEEDRDFAKLHDPLLGTKPYPGEYTVWHEPPHVKTTLPDGTRLLADYYHAMLIHDGQAMVCPSEPRTMALLEDQARRLHALWGAKTYMMGHDEIRVLNHCEACQNRKATPGKILADNVRACASILRKLNPGGRIAVWSDMFDPHHNAVPGPYYLVNGTLEESWLGLEPDMIVVPWAIEQREKSLRFFAERGHSQVIGGYYDSKPERIRLWLDSARGLNGVIGVMYTTWENRYTDLEKFSKLIDVP